MENKKKLVKKYYDQESVDYIQMYKEDYDSYPYNKIRLKMVLKRLKETGAKKVLDAGCGTCAPMIKFIEEGMQCKGFDFSKDMVEFGKKELQNAGVDPNLIFVANLENDINLPREKFDTALALGVFPHITNEKKALLNMKRNLQKNGRVFIEFRNDLFSVFTLNKYSLDFFLNQVIDSSSLPKEIAKKVINFYKEKFDSNTKATKTKNMLEYSDILAKFKNPLTIEKELFVPCGFKVDNILFYHYHALPPVFESIEPKIFRKISLKLENPYDWRGYLMASAFVVEAKKID